MSPITSRKRYQRALKLLESLEPRTLLSATITPYTVSSLGAGAAASAYDSSGNLWVLNAFATSGYSLDEVAATSPNPIQSIPLDSGTYSPTALATGPGGIIYAADGAGGIDVIDTVGLTATQHLFTTAGAPDTPVALTVSGNGAVWFVGSVAGADSLHQVNVIGRFDPSDFSVTKNLPGDLPGDAVAWTLAPSGADSVWVALTSTVIQTEPVGTNHIVAASYTTNATNVTVDQVYAVNTGDPIADQNNFISSVIDGGDGIVWFTLANNNLGQAPQGAPDQIVQFDTNSSTQTAYALPGSSDTTQLGVTSLNFDVDGNLWFAEAGGSQFGFLYASNNFTTFGAANSQNQIVTQVQMVANPDGDQLSIITSGEDIIRIDIPTQAITFNFTAVYNVNSTQGANIASTLLATFTAPDPVNTSGYTADITWGDGTTSLGVAVTPMGENSWEISAPSKSFATQGTYTGSITVKDGSATVGSTDSSNPLVFNIGDIPLNVTSFTASPLIFNIVTATGSFTDDPNLALSTWSATINWGDGNTSRGIIVRDPSQPGRYLILGVHHYRTRGTYNLNLTVTTSEVGAAVTNSTLSTTVTAR